MSGLNVQHTDAVRPLRRVDEYPAEERVRSPRLYLLVELVLFCILGALIYEVARVS